MANIIGIITAWCADKFVEPAILQAMEYCDEVFICVAPHSELMKLHADDTERIAAKYKNKINFIEFSIAPFSVHTESKSMILNIALHKSKLFNPGNWVWILDVDEFYTDKSVKYIKDIIASNQYDQLEIEEYFFYINMKKYLLGSHNRLFKIKDKTNIFFPTQYWPYSSNKCIVPAEYGMFHYSMLLDPNAKLHFWKTEYHGKKQDIKITWLDKIYRNYDLDYEDIWLDKNNKLFGYYSPWFSPSFLPMPDGRLFTFNGDSPKFISHLTHITDFRKLYNFGA